MDMHEAANRLNGSEYGKEGSRDLWAEMKAARLVAIFGASDDLIEFRGAIYDELGAYDGTDPVPITKSGLPKNECDNDGCPYHQRMLTGAATVQAIWGESPWSWTYRTNLPHAEFEIHDEGAPYCKGIVICLEDCPT